MISLQAGLTDKDRRKLAEYLALEEVELGRTAPEEGHARDLALVAHRLNQANARVLLGLSWLHGVRLVSDEATRAENGGPPSLAWNTKGAFAQVDDPHRLLAGSASFPWSATFAQGLARWGALARDPAFATYVSAQVAALGDDLVGEGDVESITGGVSVALTDLVVGEARLQMSLGRVDNVLELAKLATKSGIDAVYWTTAFRPLRAVFQAEIDELQGLLEGSPGVRDVELYLRRVKALTAPWAEVKDDGVIGTDQLIDGAVMRAVDQLRVLDYPAVILEPMFDVLTQAESLARSDSVRERAREFRKVLERYREVLCHYCHKRGAALEASVVLRARKVLSSQYVGYNTIRTTYSVTAGFVPRCESCAELHDWATHFGRYLIIAAVVAAPIAWWGTKLVVRGWQQFLPAAGILLFAFLVKWLVAALVTPRGERAYWSYATSPGYMRLKGEGYGITKRDYRKDAYAKLKVEGLR